MAATKEGDGTASRRLALMGAAFVLLVAAAAGWLLLSRGAHPFRGNTSSYSVLLVTLDTTRADRLGCYGRREARTPILDGLADAGALFESAYTPAVMTLPSHASILTGLLPPEHGVRNNGTYRLRPAVETLAEVLRASGYRTGAVVGSFVLDSMFGLDQGFDLYDDALPEAGPHDVAFSERSAGEVTDAALRFVDKAKEGRWFLWVHYFDPHSPYQPPSPHREQFDKSRYDGEIAYVDAQLGRLLAGLDEIGARDRTIVVVVADHGEGLTDHGDPSHGVFLYDEATRVPLLVRVPGFLEEPRRVAAVVRTTDVMPTILDLLRIPPRPGIDGTSLWPLMDGQVEDLGLAAYSEAAVPLLLYGWSPTAALREGKWKLIAAPREELYDMAADPKEMTNLASREPAAAEALRRSLESRLRAAAEAGRAAEALSPAPEEQARLRSLGYAAGGGGGGADPLAADPMILIAGGSRGLPDPKDRVDLLARINKVYAAYGAGEFQTVVSLAGEILSDSPENDSVRQYLAGAYTSLGRFDEAVGEYRKMLGRNPANVDALLNLGWALLSKGETASAKGAFQKALSLHPGHPYAMASLGNIAFVEGKFPEAAEFYRQVLLQRPNHVQSVIGIAKVFEQQGLRKEAEVSYKHALEIDPKNIDAWLSLGWLQFSGKEFEEALKTLELATAVDPNLPELNLYRGDILLALGRTPEAEQQYRLGVSKAPGAPQGYHGLGLAAMSRGDLALAQRFFIEALRRDPGYNASREELQKVRAVAAAGG